MARGQTIVTLDDIDLSALPQPTQAEALRYWFDDDEGSVETVNQLSGTFTLDVSSLTEGLHNLHYQVIGTDNRVAYVRSGLFLKVDEHVGVTTAHSLRYWFDDNKSSTEIVNQLTGTYTLNVSSLTEGLHTLHYQVIGTDNRVANVRSGLFLKMDEQAGAITPQSLRYWFDNETTETGRALSWGVLTVDASTLLDGLHTIHYQVVGNDGMANYLSSAIFLKMGSSFTPESVSARKLLYWFDEETTIQQADIGEGVQLLDASELTEGLHTLHYQVLCDNGQMTSTMSALFLRVGSEVETTVAQSLRYWFDEEQAATEISMSDGVQLLDASLLTDGLHTIHYQIVDSKGTLCTPHSSVFLKMDAGAITTASSIRYWFDNEQVSTESAITEGVQLLDASLLTDGLHTVHYQIVDSKGTLCTPHSSVFLKMDANAVATAQSLRYWFDNDVTTVRVTDVTNGTQMLDVSDLLTGLHTLNYQLIDSNGKVDIPTTRIFFKDFDRLIAEGTNRVTKYQYWLNTNSQGMQTVELASAANPYSLLALLPMQHEPIHSDCFQFEVNDGVPTVYAKNIFHIRFHDAQGYFSDGERPFVDYSVSQAVIPVGELQTSQTFSRVSENDIRWYTMQVAPGDTAAFRVSQPATVQVFAPSGKEVFNTSESTSINWNGIHTWENGMYYVAVHDVTGSQTNMTLDYMHMDKYDVVDWDVHTVGNGGCSTITFKGNGFQDLYAVDLFDAVGDTIRSVYISHDSDAETAVAFDFTSAELGEYDAVFHFTQEDKIFSNIVSIEEAVDIELTTNVSFPSTFLRGTSTTYTIKITNKGNMTAYCVPLDLRLRIGSKEDISELWYNDYMGSVTIPEEILIDSLDEDVLMIVKEEYEKMSDISQFVFYHDSINNVDYGLSQMFLNIRPNTTELLTVTIKSNTEVALESSITKEWVPITCNDNITSRAFHIKRKSAGEWMCCHRQQIECVADVIVSIAGNFMPPGANCATSLSVTGLEAIYDILCSEGNTASEKFKKYLEKEGKSLVQKLISSASSCVTRYFNKYIRDLRRKRDLANASGNYELQHSLHIEIMNAKNDMKFILANIGQNVAMGFLGKDCYDAFIKPKPNCPPNHDDGGGSSTPVAPRDPNDIYGYTAESGSKTVKDGLTDVYYRIEFENDPEFATAPAHDIYLADTLDATKFDLSTFAPTRINIGEKSAELNGDKNYVTTVDMRPQINAIAQVEGTFDQAKGIARWHISSLDPMTMEPTTYVMDGVLPVNSNGNGIGEVMFDIKLKDGLTHGTEIHNRAGIVFDTNETIMTPYWTNTIDRVAPESHVANVVMATDSTAAVSIAATDELSGPWRYNVYVQYGSGAWFLGAENVPIDKAASVRVYEGINHGFYTIVTDSAGNVEQKDAVREYTLEVFGSQVETNTQLALAEGWNWISQNQQEALSVEAVKPKAQRIVSQTEELYKDARLGWSGDLEELLPTEMYKVQMTEGNQVQLSGLLFNAAFRSVPLREGWNWMGYPVAHTMTPAEALAKLEAEEGDILIGQDGMAQYSDGQWTGTLTELQPGLGYMYFSVSDKNLFLNATAQSSSRMVHRSRFMAPGSEMPEGWTVNKRKYPNVMGMVCDLYQEGTLADHDEWLVGAFSGDECRGLSQTVGGHLMMNIYGQGGEEIVFLALHRESGEVLDVSETETFRSDVLGSLQLPYELHSGVPTGIAQLEDDKLDGESYVYDLQGRRVKKSSVFNSQSSMQSKGIYIMTDGKKSRTRKVVKK